MLLGYFLLCSGHNFAILCVFIHCGWIFSTLKPLVSVDVHWYYRVLFLVCSYRNFCIIMCICTLWMDLLPVSPGVSGCALVLLG